MRQALSSDIFSVFNLPSPCAHLTCKTIQFCDGMIVKPCAHNTKTSLKRRAHNRSPVLACQRANKLGVADAFLQGQTFHLSIVDQTQSAVRKKQNVAWLA